VRFVSYEPALGPVDFAGMEWLDWIIVGGESGPKARPFDTDWARTTIEQCETAGVKCFVKQLGTRPIWHGPDIEYAIPSLKNDRMELWPPDLQVREWPR